ncbi:CRISPR-associated endonuclease Cas2 [Vibrio breoganii]
MNSPSLYLVCYDVQRQSVGKKILTLVNDYSHQGQKSAYECYLNTKQKRTLIGQIEALIEPGDRFLIHPLDTSIEGRCFGIAEPSEFTPSIHVR